MALATPRALITTSVFLSPTLPLLPSAPPPSLSISSRFAREIGIPSYNDVREAYGLPRASTFDSITSDDTVQGLLEGAYDKVEMLDAYTGALAESQDGSGLFVGPLLRVR